MESEKRIRKKSKRLSQSTEVYDDMEPPKKRSKRTKSISQLSPPEGHANRNGRRKNMIVSLDFGSLSLGGVPLSDVGSSRGIKRVRRSVSLASSAGTSIPDDINKPPINFKDSKFIVSSVSFRNKV